MKPQVNIYITNNGYITLTELTTPNGEVTPLCEIVCQGLVKYNRGSDPKPDAVEWMLDYCYAMGLFFAENPGKSFNGTQGREPMTVAAVAARFNIPEAAIRGAEAIALHNASVSTAMESARIQRGREQWAAMSRDEREALNQYAFQCEGHTI